MEVVNILAVDSYIWMEFYKEILENSSTHVFSAKTLSDVEWLVRNDQIDLAVGEFHFPYENYAAATAKCANLLEERKIPVVLVIGSRSNRGRIYDTSIIPISRAIFRKGPSFSSESLATYVNKSLLKTEDFVKPRKLVELKTQHNIDFSINEDWSARDFSLFFDSIQSVYSFVLFTSSSISSIFFSDIKIPPYEFNEYIQSGINEFMFAPLKVSKIQFSSPGSISFQGIRCSLILLGW